MPVPHFNIKITQRSKGNSAVAGAAYQAGEKLFSEYDQKTKNYTCKKEVVYTEIMLPPNAPPEYADRATLWNSVEEIEKQALEKKSYIEYLLDILLYDTPEEKKALVAEQRKEVMKLEQRIAGHTPWRTSTAKRMF